MVAGVFLKPAGYFTGSNVTTRFSARVPILVGMKATPA
jgi:hypothetical protein